MEQREIVASEDYNSKGTYGKSIKLIPLENNDSAARKKLEDAVINLGLSYRVTNNDIEIYNHKNFEHLNTLIFVSALQIKKDLDSDVTLVTKSNSGKVKKMDFSEKVSYLTEEIINDAAINIYDKLSSKYPTKTHVKETTIARMKFSIISYIILINETSEEIDEDIRVIKGAYEAFKDQDHFDKFLENQTNIEIELETLDVQENDEEKIIESISIESDEDEDKYVAEIKNNKNSKIIKFKEEGNYITIERFVDLLEDLAFLGNLTDAIINTFDYCRLDIVPFNSENYNNKEFEMTVTKTEERLADPKEFKSKINSKNKSNVITFRQGKNIYVVPKSVKNGDFTNDDIYTSPSKFCKNSTDSQRENFFKTVSTVIKNNVQSIDNINVTSEDSNWFHFIISDNDNIYSK